MSPEELQRTRQALGDLSQALGAYGLGMDDCLATMCRRLVIHATVLVEWQAMGKNPQRLVGVAGRLDDMAQMLRERSGVKPPKVLDSF